ncbi:hypothetical protein TI39_contig5921g00001 [Zymoseptoria brevis]|uniref:Uncharacterized protein n=1 Tax=Zymoseptoria brevis TaxID=1047168 RepID=A0A0F4G787_9PEZI|nr:hypothetical protein TI39_contig5921g00001 [Zymoseptoria brevis]
MSPQHAKPATPLEELKAARDAAQIAHDSSSANLETAQQPRQGQRTLAKLEADRSAAQLAHKKTGLELQAAQRAYNASPKGTATQIKECVILVLLVVFLIGIVAIAFSELKRTGPARPYTTVTTEPAHNG